MWGELLGKTRHQAHTETLNTGNTKQDINTHSEEKSLPYSAKFSMSFSKHSQEGRAGGSRVEHKTQHSSALGTILTKRKPIPNRNH